MATTFKTFLSSDVTTTRTLLHEAIPLTGTIVSGTYVDASNNETNIKTYGHGMFESVYDYPYLSSSANHVLDITMGYSTGSHLSASTNTQNGKKINLYNQMAQVLMGHDISGAIQLFDPDGDLSPANATKMHECYFLNFSRLVTKDEVKKGSFSLKFRPSGTYATRTGSVVTVADTNAQNDFRVNSPAGEYGILKDDNGSARSVGLVYYQAGVAVVTASLFTSSQDTATNTHTSQVTRMPIRFGANTTHGSDAAGEYSSFDVNGVITGSTIQTNANAVRNMLTDVQFNNTTELNSTIYFCRVNHNDFNYSSNPTYLSSSKMVVKNVPQDHPVTYITTVGLYSADNELLAVAKLSEPLKKDPTTEMTLRVRLDY